MTNEKKIFSSKIFNQLFLLSEKELNSGLKYSKIKLLDKFACWFSSLGNKKLKREEFISFENVYKQAAQIQI